VPLFGPEIGDAENIDALADLLVEDLGLAEVRRSQPGKTAFR
jgi:hypothetical protein